MLKRILLFCVLLLGVRPLLAGEPSVLLAAVGDVMLARGVPQRIATHGAAWPWEQLPSCWQIADVRMCNLECAVTTGGQQIVKRYSFRADPRQAVDVLTAGKITVASLANNHSYDYARTGLTDTVRTVTAAGIATPGAGKGRAGAIAPRIITRNGLRIAVVAYTWWTPEGYLPQEDATCLATLDETTLAQELTAAKQQADCLVVSIHWGREYDTRPTEGQQRVAHLAIDAGSDVVLGHHPHVTQPVELYHDRPIFYSLGNCLFDRTDARYSTGLLALVRLSREGVTVEQQQPLRILDARPVAQ